MASHGYVVGKGKSILTTFSDNCKYSSRILDHTLQMVYSNSCTVISEITSLNFMYSTTSKSIGLSFTLMNDSFTP